MPGPGPCYYVWFRKIADPLIPEEKVGQITGNHENKVKDFIHGEMAHVDPVNYGVLEINEADYTEMQDSAMTTGTYGKHIENPTTTPTLADGNPT